MNGGARCDAPAAGAARRYPLEEGGSSPFGEPRRFPQPRRARGPNTSHRVEGGLVQEAHNGSVQVLHSVQVGRYVSLLAFDTHRPVNIILSFRRFQTYFLTNLSRFAKENGKNVARFYLGQSRHSSI